MTGNSDHSYGLDIGTATSALARTGGGETRLLSAGGESGVIPTAFDTDERTGRVLVGEEAVAAGGETRPLPRFRSDGSDRGESITEPLRVFLTEAFARWSGEEGLDGATTVLSVPGAYPESVSKHFEEAVEAASAADVAAVRSPVPALVSDNAALADQALYLAVDVGAHWVDAALIETDGGDPPRFTVHARWSRPGSGTERYESAIVEWALRAAARAAGVDPDATVALLKSDRERLRDEAAAVLKARADKESVRLRLEEPVIATVTTDGRTDRRELEVNLQFNGQAAKDALDRPLTDLAGVLGDLFERGPTAARSEIDRIVLAGGGAKIPAIEDLVVATVENSPTVRSLSRPDAAAATGANRLAFYAMRNGVEPADLVEEAATEAVDLVCVSGDTVDSVPLVPGGAPAERSYTTTLTTAVANQHQGRVDIATRDILTGGYDRTRPVMVTGIPPGDVTLELTYTPAGEQVAVSALEPDEDVTAELFTEDGSVDPVNLSWLGAAESDPSESVARESSRAPRIAPNPPDYNDETPSTQALIERLWDVRTFLWNAERQKMTMTADELRGVLNQMDAALRRFDIEPIEPDHGQPFDASVHEEIHARPANYPEGTVIKPQKPGIRIGDKVPVPARVIVANEEVPEEESAAEEPADDEMISEESAAEESRTPQESPVAEASNDGTPSGEALESEAESTRTTDHSEEEPQSEELSETDSTEEVACEDEHATEGESPAEEASETTSTTDRPSTNKSSGEDGMEDESP